MASKQLCECCQQPIFAPPPRPSYWPYFSPWVAALVEQFQREIEEVEKHGK